MGEVRGLVEGRMDEESVEDEWPGDWAAEEGDANEEGRVEEEGYGQDGLTEGGMDGGTTWG